MGEHPVKLLVTGGLGFIASNFIRHTLKTRSDVEITNVDNLSIGANVANLRDVEKDPRYRFVKGDIANLRVTSKLVRGVDTVLNLAAETHVDRSISTPNPFMRSNAIGTFTVLEAVRKTQPDARIVHVSTDEVHGDIFKGSFREGDRLKPSSPYAATKAAADMFVLAYQRTYNLDAAITRSTNNFGPHQHPEKLVPKTIIRAHFDLPVPVYGQGEQTRDWIYVLDHCEALGTVIEKGRAGEIYNISGGNEVRNIELVRSILRILRKPEDLVQFVEDRPGHDVRYSLDSSKIRSELGWRPKYSFKDALEETAKWYLKNEFWWKKQASKKTLHPTPWKLKW